MGTESTFYKFDLVWRQDSTGSQGVTPFVREIPLTPSPTGVLPQLTTQLLGAHKFTFHAIAHASDPVMAHAVWVYLGEPGISTSHPKWANSRYITADVHKIGVSGTQKTDKMKIYESDGVKRVLPQPIGLTAAQHAVSDGTAMTVDTAGTEPAPPTVTGKFYIKILEGLVFGAQGQLHGRVCSGRDLIAAGAPDVPLSLYFRTVRLYGNNTLGSAFFIKMSPEDAVPEAVDVVNEVRIDTAVPLDIRTDEVIQVNTNDRPVVVTSFASDGDAMRPVWVINDALAPY